MRITAASATHVGQVREINQDRSLVTNTLGAVADGMGGHAGGEKAAALAIAELSGVQGVISPQRLIDVAKAANDRVYDASQAPELRGMGTTLVIASFDPEAATVSIANVGDSRGYLFRDGRYEQVTLDHSLVEELLRQGRLSKDEARDHPQRNMVTRALGIGSDVDVDVFDVDVVAGDRIVLCSDGLSNEVDDAQVAEILRSRPDPGDAAQVLVDTALANGGRDNVTVVVMDVIGDDADAAVGHDDAAVGHDDAGVGHDDAGVGHDDADVGHDDVVAGHDDVDVSPNLADDYSAPGRDRSADPLIDTKRPVERRRLPFRGLLFAGSILSVMVLAMSATAWYARSAWFVDEVDGDIVIMRGRPDGVLWFQPDPIRETDLTLDELSGASQLRVKERRVLGSLDEALTFVEKLVPAGDDGG